MANLTNRQRSLLRLSNLLSQNLIANGTNDTTVDSDISSNVSVNLPGFDLDAGVDVDVGTGDGTDTPPGTPETLRDVLLSLLNEQVQVTTPFGPVTGTLIVVRDDYIVLIEASGAQVLVRIEKIEFVSDM